MQGWMGISRHSVLGVTSPKRRGRALEGRVGVTNLCVGSLWSRELSGWERVSCVSEGEFSRRLARPLFLRGAGGPAVTSWTQGTLSIGSSDHQDDHDLYSSKLLRLTFEFLMHLIGQSAT